MKILITGGCGFIGHHIVEHILKNTDWDIVILDKLSYASSGFDRLRDIKVFDDKRVSVLTKDFSHPLEEGFIREIGNIDYILHLGAETHVDKSIENPEPFVVSNVLGTMRMLDFARTQKNLKKFLYFSTDEVFGPAPEGVFYKEWDRYNSSNPYAAAKAGGEELALAYANTYKVPVIITHTMNVFGERQHPEKFIPMTVKKILNGEKVLIHSDKTKTKAGSRFWIHARNVASAILFLLQKDVQLRDKYNIVGEREIDNLEMAKTIAKILGKELKYEMMDFHSSRPGHDLRYALDGAKMKELGWNIPMPFEQSLSKTINWITAEENKKWLNL
ncbi:NAD-dependent epimerase [Candidatus Pacearchaeota archaeon CG06_land_8_20_14_3_00_35_12]|nr:MAG: NAD-dependent epimerase [Candidatus Pacearchaeota archaeon CG06_land_8_20_14_3_00_35_12]